MSDYPSRGYASEGNGAKPAKTKTVSTRSSRVVYGQIFLLIGALSLLPVSTFCGQDHPKPIPDGLRVLNCEAVKKRLNETRFGRLGDLDENMSSTEIAKLTFQTQRRVKISSLYLPHFVPIISWRMA